MKRVTVILMALLMAGLTISASGAFGFPSLGQSGTSGSSLGSAFGALPSFGQGTTASGLGSLMGGLGGSTGTGTSGTGTGSSLPMSSLGSLMSGLGGSTGSGTGTSSPSSSLGSLMSGLGTGTSSGSTSPAVQDSGSSNPYGSFSNFMPSSSQYSMPAQTSLGSSSPLSSMSFFSPSNRASAQPVSSLPASDVNGIMQMLGNLPTQDQMAQNYGGGQTTTAANATPTPSNEDTFTTNVSSTIPSDQVLFIEISRETMLIDPSGQGFAVPNVTMNYKFSDTQKKLSLKSKPGVDINTTSVVFGNSDSNDVANKYVFDYAVGNSPVSSVSLAFHGADGRVKLRVNGKDVYLYPGQKTQVITDSGGQRVTFTVTDWGLIPKANVVVADTI